MKKLILVLVSVLIGMVSMGQVVKNTAVNKVMDLNKNETYWYRQNIASDTVNQTDTTWSYTFGVNNLYDAVKQYVVVKLDSVSGTPLTTVALSGKVFWDDAWTSITTAAWAGTTGDTTLILDQSTAKHFRFYKLSHDGDGTGTFKYSITKQELQIYK